MADPTSPRLQPEEIQEAIRLLYVEWQGWSSAKPMYERWLAVELVVARAELITARLTEQQFRLDKEEVEALLKFLEQQYINPNKPHLYSIIKRLRAYLDEV